MLKNIILIVNNFKDQKEGVINLDGYFKATITKIVKGKKGIFAVAFSEQFDRIIESEKFENSITFSLNKEVWRSKNIPKVGNHVKLGKLRSTNHGWRSYEAYFWKLSDEITFKKNQSEIRNQKSEIRKKRRER